VQTDGVMYRIGLDWPWVTHAIMGPLGVVLLLGLRCVPFSFLAITAAMAGLGQEFEDAARVHGASRARAMRLIIPILAAAIWSALAIGFAGRSATSAWPRRSRTTRTSRSRPTRSTRRSATSRRTGGPGRRAGRGRDDRGDGGGRQRTAAARAGARSPAPGTDALLLIRPTGVRLCGPGDDEHHLAGRVSDVAFRGRGYEHAIDIPGHGRLTGVFADRKTARGEPVRLRLGPAGCHLFAAPAPAGEHADPAAAPSAPALTA
jgi:TOBE domain